MADFLKGHYLRRGPEAIPREIILSHRPGREEHVEEALRACGAGPWTWRCPRRGRSAAR